MLHSSSVVKLQVVTMTLTVSVWGWGCASPSAPIRRTLPTSDVAMGENTVESIRLRLEGEWNLLSLDVHAVDGRHAAIAATGKLVADGYSNVTIDYRLSDHGVRTLTGLGIATPRTTIETTGRVAIDVGQKRMTYIDPAVDTNPLDQQAGARRANPFALDRPRYFHFDPAGILTLTTKHDNGQDAAVSRWKKTP